LKAGSGVEEEAMRVRSELTAPLVALSAVLLFAGPASAGIITFPTVPRSVSA
jgi:hypothetical protein